MAELNTIIKLRQGTTEQWAKSTVVLGVGEMGLEYLQDGSGAVKIKAGDGESFWSALPYIGSDVKDANVFQVTMTANDVDDIAAIEAKVAEEGATKQNGDVAIVKSIIATNDSGEEKISYTSYVYDSEYDIPNEDGVYPENSIYGWTAMEGNYNANNVIFKDDITLAGNYDKVGNIKLSDGTLEASGKSLAELMQTIFTQELYPNNTDIPDISFSASGSSGEVGSSYTLPTATLTLTDVGSYAYGPATGITVAIGDASITQGEKTAKNTSVMTKNSTITLKATDTETLYTDTSKSYTFNASLKYSDGAVPVTNLGNEYESAQIKSNTLTASKTATFTGYRKAFAGGTSAATINSEIVRSMSATKNSKASMDSVGEALEFTAAAGTTKVFFAYPEGWTGTPYFEMFGLAWAENSNIVAKNNIDVADARGTKDGVLQGAASYKLYCWELDTPLQAETTKFRVWFK